MRPSTRELARRIVGRVGRESVQFLLWVGSMAFVAAVILVAMVVGRWQIRHTETNTIQHYDCNAFEMGGTCDQPGSLANFFVELCGRSAVTAWAGLRGGGRLFLPGIEHEPSPVMNEVALGCGRKEVRFRFPQDVSLRQGDEQKYLVNGGGLYPVFVRWSSGEITTAEAAQALKR